MKTLALDIGGSKLLAAVVDVHDDKFEIGRIESRMLAPDCTKEKLIGIIDDAVRNLGPASFENIGATIPGLADPKNGIWVYACFSGIRDFPIASILSERFGNKPVSIDNDVNACALAEKKFGACRNIDDFLWMTVSNGIGGGLVLDGAPYPGHFGAAAEIGHFSVVESNVFQCGCGNFGCLEAEAAGPGIARRYERLIRESGKQEPVGSKLSAKEIADLARQGDFVACSVMETTGDLIGKAASYAVNLLNLEAVVFGGGVMESFELFYPAMEKSFYRRLFHSANPSVKLLKTELGYHAGLAGAASLPKIE